MERILVPAELPRLLRAVHAALVEHQDEVDALNVFPVPDGDTGTNLAATAAAVVAAIPDQIDGATSALLRRAALRSARGNSGVIFSQIVRAVIEALEDSPPEASDVEVLAAALQRADVLARDAVAQPVEGTILTAVRAASDAATAALRDGETQLGPALERVRDAVSAAVRATLEQLDVLRDAGVVDAGARGFEVVVVSLLALVTGQDVQPAALENLVPRCQPGVEAGDSEHAIEVQFVVAGDQTIAAELRERLGELGDSVVVVASDGLVQAHVHTSDPEAVKAVGDRIGPLEDLRLTDLRPPAPDDEDAPTLAVVAVLPAGGLSDLGAGSGAAIVQGASGQLPTVENLLVAARRCASDVVVVLPGHHNVVPTARQAAAVAADDEDGTGMRIEVVAAADHPLLVLACLALQTPDADSLAAACQSARCGEVVRAVRDASLAFGSVRAGDPLAVVRGDVVAAGDDELDALRQLLSHLQAPLGELVTVAIGAEATVDAGAVMMAAIDEVGDAEVDVIDGGQRPALFVVAVEA